MVPKQKRQPGEAAGKKVPAKTQGPKRFLCTPEEVEALVSKYGPLTKKQKRKLKKGSLRLSHLETQLRKLQPQRAKEAAKNRDLGGVKSEEMEEFGEPVEEA